jgi:hypothetical protein
MNLDLVNSKSVILTVEIYITWFLVKNLPVDFLDL